MIRRSLLRAYIAAFPIAVVSLLGWTLIRGEGFDQDVGPWLVFTVLFAGTESVSLYFYDQNARYSLSATETMLLPMIMWLTFPQVLVGATLANVVARAPRWRVAPHKEFFNFGQYGCSAAGAAGIWSLISDPGAGFTVDNALAAIAATSTFALMSHFFVAGAIMLSHEAKFRDLTIAIAPTFIRNLAITVTGGLILAAAYAAAEWLVVLFALPLGAMFFGFRAVLRQERERERIEQLHVASRALASSPDLEHAVHGFLGAMAEIASASEARAIVRVGETHQWSGVREGTLIAALEPLDEPTAALMAAVAADPQSRVVDRDGHDRWRQVIEGLGFRNMVIVPLSVDEGIDGCLLAADRVGVDEFGFADVRLIEALSEELVLSLDSYRLFAEVAEERERFARIFTGSKEGIILLDDQGVVNAWNPALERISGYAAKDVMNRRWSDVVMIRNKDEIRIEGNRIIELAGEEELQLVTRDGPTRWISLLAGPVAEGGGWVVLVRDMTAVHEVEQAKSDFLSTISHELRTPLTTIKGSLQVLGRGTENLPPALTEQMIGVTTRGAERLERLVMNLLMVSQIESGAMPVFPEEISMSELVEDRVEAILRDHADVSLEIEPEEVHVRADRERLSQVIEHLLDNAVKFGGPNGKISVSVVRSNGYAHLRVRDEGPGVPLADQERIFERFIRLGDVLTRETQGAGVGLFIAKSAVEAMGGNIWVESEPGRGATFHVEIPLARPVAVEEAEGA